MPACMCVVSSAIPFALPMCLLRDNALLFDIAQCVAEFKEFIAWEAFRSPEWRGYDGECGELTGLLFRENTEARKN